MFKYKLKNTFVTFVKINDVLDITRVYVTQIIRVTLIMEIHRALYFLRK